MIQGREDVRLALKSGEAIRVAGKGVGEDLQRDVAAKLRIARAIHLPHAAAPKGREDLVRAEAGAGGEGQKVRPGYMGGESPTGISPDKRRRGSGNSLRWRREDAHAV